MDVLNHPYFIAAIIACMLGEYAISRYKGMDNFSIYEVISNMVLISLDKILSLFTGSDPGAITRWFSEHQLFHFDFGRPINLILLFIACEFAYYWNHWYNHNVSVGWATHVMHHSPTKYNFTLGYRLGITRLFSLGWIVFIPLLLIGFDPKDVAVCVGIIFGLQFFLHSELFPKMGFLDKILNTPSNHRVHHSSDPRYYNKNLGGLTTMFDHLFGTYQREDQEGRMQYGMAEVMQKKSICYEITCHWQVVWKRLCSNRGFKGKFLAIFGAP